MFFIKSFFHYDKLPNDDIAEICLLGRSNVGKSSLINMINNTKLAKTSKIPGSTRLINLFSMDKIRIIDLPGYGYAKAPKETVARWGELLYQYITERDNLQNRILLIDGKVGFKKNDLEMIEILKNYNYEVFFTKSEKLSQLRKQELIKFCESNNIRVNPNHFCSSKTGLGRKNILQFINQYNVK